MTRLDIDTGADADRTRPEPSGPTTQRDPARLVRGAVLAGKYRLELQLGEGGMAVVWSAYHLELEIPVAIKLLRGHDPRLAQRLKLEARAAARLVHPAIVRVFDVATTDDGDPFIVMELLSGERLGDALARGHVGALRVVQLLLPIVDALAVAHDHGVIHRDLKPENVFLSLEGDQLQPKLLDFGIAKLAGGLTAIRLTANGTALGSPSYMSPEQARGDDVSHLSDIWSLCVMLYKAIGGKSPFRGAHARDVLDAILQQEPEPLPLGAGVDGHLARIVLSGLSKDPAERPQSMRLLGQQLARWLLLHGVSIDACGAPLVSKWLSTEPPTKPRASDAPPQRRQPPAELSLSRLPSPPRVPSFSVAPRGWNHAANESTAPQRIRKAPPVWRAAGAHLFHLDLAKHRRWMLWALAGVLVAGGSLALTSSAGSRSHDGVAPPAAIAMKDAPLPVDSEDDPRATESQRDQPLVVNESDASPSTLVPSDARRAATSIPEPATPAPRAPVTQRAKTSPPTSRPALPF